MLVPELVLTNVAAGQYSIRAYGVDAQQNFFYSPAVTFQVLLPNDDFAKAAVLEGANISLLGDLRGATWEPGESDRHPSAWWRWTAPRSGWLVIEPAVKIQVFQGDALNNLTRVPYRPTNYENNVTTSLAVEAGVTYRIRASAYPSWGAYGYLGRFTLGTIPANDNFGARAPLTGENFRLEASMVLAGTEPGEPAWLTNSDRVTLWYSWTAPADGMVFAGSLVPYDPYGVIALFTGDSLATLQKVDSPARVLAGQILQIALFGSRIFPAPIAAQFDFFRTPANDLFDNAEALAGSTGEITADASGATSEPEPWGQGYNTVWYDWTAPSNGVLRLRLADAIPGLCCTAQAWLYRGTELSALERIPARDVKFGQAAEGQPGWSAYQFPVAGGTNYHICVFPSTRGAFKMSYELSVGPWNDTFARRSLLQGPQCQWAGSTELASLEPGETPDYEPQTGHSLWYQWTAPASGWVLLRIQSTNASAALTMDKGSDLTNLVPVEPLPPVCAGEQWRRVEQAANYVLAVNDYYGGEFSAELELATARVILPEQDPDFSAPKQVRLALSAPAPEIDGEFVGVQFVHAQGCEESVLGTAANPFVLQTAPLAHGYYFVSALATNRAGQVRRCAPAIFVVGPTNDLFARRQALSGRVICRQDALFGAGREPGEPILTGVPGALSVWYTWRAPADGDVLAKVTSPWSDWYEQSPFRFGIYTGDALASLQPVPTLTREFGEIQFSAARGQVFQFAVECPSPHETWFDLRLRLLTVSLRNNHNFVEGDPIILEAQTTERPEDLAAIDFFADTQLLASVSAPPYQFTWTNAPARPILVTALARLASDDTNAPMDQTYLYVVPRNDSFAARQPLAGTNLWVRGNTVLARSHGGEPASGSVWFSWTPPCPGRVHFTPAEGSACPYIQVFSGDSPEALTPVAVNYNEATWQGPFPLAFLVRPETTYQTAMRALSGNGDFEMQLTFEPGPANDDFAGAAPIPGNTTELRGSFALATVEAGEPGYSWKSYGDEPRHSLWWRWVAPARGTVCLANLAKPEDGYWIHWDYGFYIGATLGELVLVTNLYKSLSPPRFGVEAGRTYYLAINAPNDSMEAFAAGFAFTPAPANDDFDFREFMEGRRLTILGSTLGATVEADEPAHSFRDAWGSVWYSWTAPFSGTLALWCSLSSPWAYTTVYNGDRLTGLTPVRNVPDTWAFVVQEGMTYQIAVDTGGPTPGAFELNLLLRHDTPPPNDLFARRLALDTGAAPVKGWNHHATREWLEPRHANRWGGRSAWYAWTAPASGTAALRLQADEHPMLIGVYEGADVAVLTPVAESAPEGLAGELRFAAQKGREYAIVLDGENGATTAFEIQVAMAPVVLQPSLALRETAPGSWALVVGNLAGQNAALESSADLCAWEPMASYPGGTDEWQVPLTVQARQPARFFRAIIPE